MSRILATRVFCRSVPSWGTTGEACSLRVRAVLGEPLGVLFAERRLHTETLGLTATDLLCELLPQPRDDCIELQLLSEEKPGGLEVAPHFGLLGLGLQAGELDLESIELPTCLCVPLVVLREGIIMPAASCEGELVGVRFAGGQDLSQSVIHLGDGTIVVAWLPDALPDLSKQGEDPSRSEAVQPLGEGIRAGSRVE